MLKRRNEHRWSALSFEKEPTALCVRIYEPCVKLIAEFSRRYLLLPDYRQQWGFKSFEPDPRRGFGFDKGFPPATFDGNYLVLKAPLSRGVRCKPAAIVVSTHLLFETFTCAGIFLKKEVPADPDRLQFMEVRSLTSGKTSGTPLGGSISPAFADWIRCIAGEPARLEEVETEIKRAMWLAWNAASGDYVSKGKHPDLYPRFSAGLGKQGEFVLKIAGDRPCNVSTSAGRSGQEDGGHGFSYHDADSPAKQLSLLAGLAAMHGIADDEIYKRPPE